MNAKTLPIAFDFFQAPKERASPPVATANRRPVRLCRRRSRPLPLKTDLRPIEAGRRTGLVLDWNNIFISARGIGRGFDHAELLASIRSSVNPGGSSPVVFEPIAVLSAIEPEKTTVSKRLIRSGFEVISETSRQIGPRTKADMDAAIGAACMKLVIRNRVSQLVLVSGDSDFASMLTYLRQIPAHSRNLNIVAMGVPGSTATVLRKAADACVLLGRDMLK